jgi:hypothetical protein
MPRTNIPRDDPAQPLRPANPADALWVSWQSTIDALYSEGLAGSPKCTVIAFARTSPSARR